MQGISLQSPRPSFCIQMSVISSSPNTLMSNLQPTSPSVWPICTPYTPSTSQISEYLPEQNLQRLSEAEQILINSCPLLSPWSASSGGNSSHECADSLSQHLDQPTHQTSQCCKVYPSNVYKLISDLEQSCANPLPKIQPPKSPASYGKWSSLVHRELEMSCENSNSSLV